MPNWCRNELSFSGNEKDMGDFISGLTKGVDSGQVVASILETYAPLPTGVEHDGITQSDWWGCKWKDQFASPDWDNPKDYAMLSFDTPWGPPFEGLQKISARWPQLSFSLQYREEGMCFAGVAAWSAGVKLFEHEMEIPEFYYPEEDDYLDITGELDEAAYQEASDIASAVEYKFYNKLDDLLQEALEKQ